ncbi:MAG: amino acid adenylation domain-containing protein, partial [Acidobacteriota bacterium]
FIEPTVAALAREVERVRQGKEYIASERIGPVSREQALPLSFAQLRLWFIDQLIPGCTAYNLPIVTRLIGPLKIAALKQSLDEIVQRHEILRTTFITIDGEPVQIIAPTGSCAFSVVNLMELPATKQETEIRQVTNETIQQPFSLSQGPLLYVKLLRLAESEHLLIVMMHHIVSDGWSLGIFIQELATFYEAFSQGIPVSLTRMKIQYADFAYWQQQWLQGEVLTKQLSYWKEQLKGDLLILELPVDRQRSSIKSFHGAACPLTLSPDLSELLRNLSLRANATLYMTLLAAFQTLLYRYTGQLDILIGTPIANRNRVETEGLIGFFVNMLVIRVNLSTTLSFLDMLQQVREVMLGAYAHQDLPFEKLVEELHPQRDFSHNPLFQVIFALQNAPLPQFQLQDLSICAEEFDTETTRVDLEFHLWQQPDGIRGLLIYDSELFQTATIDRMAKHFTTLLESIVANPEQTIAQLPMLSQTELDQILVEWNSTVTNYPATTSVQQLFEAQVKRTPDAIAVSCGEHRLSYHELNLRANQLAHYLQSLGVRDGMPIGICLERSMELIVALLGILKAGGAYLPLDISLPSDRLTTMLNDAQVPILLTEQRWLDLFTTYSVLMVCLDSDKEMIAKQDTANLDCQIYGDNLAYIIYTSGSTGSPKGVCIPHKAITRLVINTNYLQLLPSDRIAQVSNTSFDAATFEIWGALLNGAELVVITKEVALAPREFAAQLETYQISTLFLTTALFNELVRQMPDAFKNLHQLLVGGEAIDPGLVRRVLEHTPPARLLNVYGPTENTTFSTWYLVEVVAEQATTIPIGHPISNTETYILDAQKQPVAIGVVGELYLGGNGLAHGYFQRPELTAERFIPHPFSNQPGARLYRTGDLVRYLVDGSIEFVGRIDRQIKIRGFRIELEEIEAVLVQHSDVDQAIVMVRENGNDSKSLIAYLGSQSQPLPTNHQLRDFLQNRLPEYMIPMNFVVLAALPLTSNGKIDHRALSEIEIFRSDSTTTLQAPRDLLELRLVELWEETFNISPIGIKDDFFELGGHSLLATRMMAQIKNRFGQDLSVSLLFQGATIEHLANFLRRQANFTISSTLVAIHPGGTKPPLFCVHEIGGGVLDFIQLARNLGPQQPVYGLQSIDLEKDTTIEEMAANYIAALQKVQSQGPYFLAGWSFGGLIAFEMAQQLHKQHQQVALLALLDAVAPVGNYRLVYHYFSHSDETTLLINYISHLTEENLSLDELPTIPLDEQVSYILAQAKLKQLVPVDTTLAEIRARLHSYNIRLRAAQNYLPAVYSGPITLFRASEIEPSAEQLYNSDVDATLGWRELSTVPVTIEVVPGSHYTMVREPYVQVLAKRLMGYI